MLIRSEDGSIKGSDIEQYYQAIIPAFEKAGYSTRPGPHLEEWFHEAGFVNIHVHKYRVPIGVWSKDSHYVSRHSLCFPLPPFLSLIFFFEKFTNAITLSMQKKLGTWFLLQAEQGFEGAAMAVLTRFESWSPDEVTVLAAGVLKDAKNPKIHGLFDL